MQLQKLTFNNISKETSGIYAIFGDTILIETINIYNNNNIGIHNIRVPGRNGYVLINDYISKLKKKHPKKVFTYILASDIIYGKYIMDDE